MKYLRTALILSWLALGFLSSGAFGQGAEQLKTLEQTSVEVSRRPGSMVDQVDVKNMVNVTARHCQAYEKKHNGFAKFFLGRKNSFDLDACNADASTIFFTHSDHNLRTTAGGDWQASVMGNTAAPPATGNYIALSNDAGAPAVGDTTLTGEITLNGLARAQGTYSHTNGTASYTIQKVFTATGTQASQKAGLLNASSSGTMIFENTYTSVTVNNGDTLTVTWTVNY